MTLPKKGSQPGRAQPPQDIPKPGPCCQAAPPGRAHPCQPGRAQNWPCSAEVRPALALTGQGEEMKAVKRMMAGGLTAAPCAGGEPGVLPVGIPGGTCPLPGAAGLSAGTRLPADHPDRLTALSQRAGGDAALPGRGLLGQRQPCQESLGRASWYIPSAGAEGMGAPRSGAPGMGMYRRSLATSRDSLPAAQARSVTALGWAENVPDSCLWCRPTLRGTGVAVEATAQYL